MDQTRMVWDMMVQDYAPHRMLGALVEGKALILHDGNRGTIGHAKEVLEVVDARAVLLAHRLFDSVLGPARPEELRLVGPAERSGHPCVVVEQEVPGGSYDRWWLAEDQEYSPIYWQFLEPDGRPGPCVSIEYERSADAVWRLKSWSSEHIYGGKFVESQQATVTELRLNEPVDPSLFQITFPPGTHVFDQFEERDYDVGEEPLAVGAVEEAAADREMEEFVEKVRKEEAERPKPQPRPQPTPAQPAAAPPPQAAVPPAVPARGISPWLIVGAAALVLLMIAAIVLARRKARA